MLLAGEDFLKGSFYYLLRGDFMKNFKNSFVKYVLLIMLLPAVILTSCTGKVSPDSDNTASYADGEESETEYFEPNIDLTDIWEYTGIVFPEDSELLEAYTSKSKVTEDDEKRWWKNHLFR